MPTDRPIDEHRTGDLDRKTLLALIDASRSINEALEPSEICRRVAAHAAAVLDAEGASVLLHDADRGELVFYAVVGPDSAQVVQSTRFPASEGIAGQVVKTRRAVRIDDVRQNRNFYGGIDDITKTRTRNMLAAPLIHCDAVLGVVEVINSKHNNEFTDHDLSLLQLFANLVVGAARNAQVFDRLSRENRGLRESLPPVHFIGESEAFGKVLVLCRKVAPSTTTVLLEGESGTGKEMAARTICALSARSGGPFVAVNCAALPESLIESELFGHEAGAFTGATSQRPGKFELAHGGTLLLDEISELDPAMQAKFLRVLEACEVTRIGGSETVACDVRLIVATNRDLKSEVAAGRFREDLYYRIGVFPILLPPLRDRIVDLPLLIEHLMAQVAPSLMVNLPTVSDEAMAAMMRYRWPGNVRELRNVIERAVLVSEGAAITPEHLPRDLTDGSADGTPATSTAAGSIAGSALAEQEYKLVLAALEQNDWNQSAAARQLGISRDILRSRVKRYGLKK